MCYAIYAEVSDRKQDMLERFFMLYCVLAGRLVADPEIFEPEDGKPFFSFSMACDFFDKGDKRVFFVKVMARVKRYGKAFSSFGVKKGFKICVCGSFVVRDWTDRDGHPRKDTIVFPDSIEFMSVENASPDMGERCEGGDEQ